jgi:hypothetical protein
MICKDVWLRCLRIETGHTFFNLSEPDHLPKRSRAQFTNLPKYTDGHRY